MNHPNNIVSYGDSRDNDIEEIPNDGEVEYWIYDSVCPATDGCQVEPDGTCEHGHDSWLLALGYV